MALGDIGLGTLGTGVGGILGIAGGIFSGITGSEDAKKMAEIQKQEIADQMQQDRVREQAMELDNQQAQIQNIRTAQMARAMALSTTTAQGAAYGSSSALGGAYGSIAGQTNVNQMRESQALQSNRQMFTLSEQLSGLKMNMADMQGKAMEDSALGNMFGGIGKSLGPLGNFAQSTPGIFKGLFG